MFEPLMLELARKGHQVVVISKHPHKEKVPNYEHVDVNNDAPMYTSNLPFTIFKRVPVSLSEDLEALYMYVLCTRTYNRRRRVYYSNLCATKDAKYEFVKRYSI